MAATDPLLQPYRLKHLELRNRIMSTAHEPAYSEDGLPKDRYRLYHEEKAKGGIALTVIGGSTIIAPDTPAVFGNLYAGNDDIIPWLQKLVDGVHAHGAAVMCQITHLGRRTVWNTGDWLPIISPSLVREPAHRGFPKEMEDWDIRRVVKAYGDAARRCKEGGMDGVEVEAYGHLIDAFWSPRTNQRTDAYGGSLDNRMRFGLEVFESIRRKVGDDTIVGIRMVVDEDAENGITRDEGFEIARCLAATGMIDFINVIKGHIESDEALSHVIPNMGTPAAPHLALASAVKAEHDIAVFHAARINEIATARHSIAEGHLDMVGMTRAHMADPHIAAKLMRGEEERIRPCVGAGYCIDRLYEAGDALCVHNPATGREATMPQVFNPTEGEKKKIVVVGAGPAGLEAARVSASRGHDVVLMEAADRAGGQVVVAAGLDRRKEIIGIVDWLASEVEALGVDMRFNTFAEAEDVLAENPDIVIVATGGMPNTEFLEAGEDLATTGWDILTGQVTPAADVILFDDIGQHQALSVAEAVAKAGSNLEIVTPNRAIGQETGGLNYPAYYKVFYEKGVKTTLNLRLTSIARDGNQLVGHFYNEYDKSVVEKRADQIIVEHGTRPFDDLYFELKPGSVNQGEIDHDALIAGRPQDIVNNRDGTYTLFRVGDAVAGRNIHTAIYDSLRLCKDF